MAKSPQLTSVLMVALGLFAGFLIARPSCTAAQEVESLKQRFLREAPEQWRDYLSLARRLQGTSELTESETQTGQDARVLRQTVVEIKQCGDWSYVKWAELGPVREKMPVGGGNLANSKYSAAVKQKVQDGGWLLEQLHLSPKGGGRPARTEEFRRFALSTAAAFLLRVERQMLPDVIKNPTFELKEVVRADKDPRLVRVAFSAKRPPDDRMGSPRMEGSLILDPDHHWVITEGKLRLFLLGLGPEVPCDFEFTYESREGQDRLAIPTRTVKHSSFTHGDRWRKVQEVVRFNFSEQDTVPESEFSLTTFGLPEPVGVTFPRPIPWYFWFAGAGAGLLLAGFGLFKLARRRRAQANPESVPAK